MKHPEHYIVTVTCLSCGTEHKLATGKADLTTVEVCSACHPAYTGGDMIRRKSDRIERFERRRARARKEG